MKITFTDWIPVFALPALAVLIARPALPAWGLLFAVAFSIFYGFKWLTYRRAACMGARPGLKSAIGYLFCWVGMDAAAFFDRRVKVPKPSVAEWLLAFLKTALGLVLFSFIARLFYPQHALTAGYIGLTGFLLFSFFGTFHILSLYWRRRGVNAVPMMNSPLLTTSLSEFWSSRWNLAFRDLARIFVFRPMLKRWGVVIAVLSAFVFSGILHELLISLPADAWYGLPTLFFLIQAGGIFIEKSGIGMKAGINHGLTGRLFAALFILAPVVLLFHPPSIESCMIPFMKALGALR
ncbi:MAG TPA: MBOAT family protein [Thermodesulfobacteriota bacterium]|nr:MBOAT family protein [Thermodesulfobacteriota bacterium]